MFLPPIRKCLLVDAKLGLAGSSERWWTARIVRNLLYRHYYTNGFRRIDNLSGHVGEPWI